MATTTPRMKITYATLSADNEELQSAFDAAVERVRGTLGQSYPMLIGGDERRGAEEFEDRSPIDRDIVVARFPVGTRQDVRDAIAAARAAFPAWRDLGWRQRLEILRNAADLISERQFEYAALMAFEVGKNRLEALGDVEETADLLRYYSDEMERNGGFVQPMGSLSPTEHTRSVLKPHGVWGVISPFNFPMALAGGPAAGALIAGNTVVLKPSSDAPLMGYKFGEVLHEAGVPAGVFNFVTGPGETVGAELQESPDIDGMVFTGSYEVGMKLYTGFTRDYPRPIITEMGGKNPAIITASADLDEAAEGVMRSAFGYRRAEVQRQQPGLRRALGGAAVRREAGRARQGRSRSATRPSATTGWGPSSTSDRSPSSPPRWTRRSATAGPSRPVAKCWPSRAPSAATSPRPPW